VLTVSDLRVRYGSIAALKGISFEVREGEVVGLVGPNGAGKSTTLAAIVGLVSPVTGSIIFSGESLVGRAPEAITRLGIALVPEGRQIFGTLTVAENLRLGQAARGANGDFESDLERVLELFPILRKYYGSSAGKLSGGEQQQLAIARALTLRPRLLLLDEPSLGLAPRVVDLVFEILGHLREEGVTMLLVEQVAVRTIQFADRTYVLRNGVVTLAGAREELLKRTDVSAAYMGF
jgi:branched-chain amino acid transport system ATP-binding protein